MNYAFDPELAAVAGLIPDLATVDIPTMRAVTAEMFSSAMGELDHSGLDVRDELVPGAAGDPDVRLRIYTPDQPMGPAAVYYVHGGGFIIGSIDMFDGESVRLARQLGVVVVSVEYRMAPEHPYPAALEDCYAGLQWMAENSDTLHIDASRIAIHGSSAGGGLCAGLTLLARDRGGPSIAFQALGVPELDDRLETASMRAFTDTPMWARPQAILSWDAYLGSGRRGTSDIPSYAAPARATDLIGLPPAYISVMEFDPLRDEGIAYAQALMSAGISVELHAYPGTFHGSGIVEQAAVSRREAEELLVVLRRALKL
ncbi:MULTISPECIES: alpha/beta hydrolase [unclassified Mycobacterium]|uniref:alpha/beta hydrolase n=1 Tax=unclassified Mycobacterium TaxID=2642494 RepID=UPI0029C92A38|nr:MULTISPECIES: alpha/beta hydrolase [unclassified Mycobacterium]